MHSNKIGDVLFLVCVLATIGFFGCIVFVPYSPHIAWFLYVAGASGLLSTSLAVLKKSSIWNVAGRIVISLISIGLLSYSLLSTSTKLTGSILAGDVKRLNKVIQDGHDVNVKLTHGWTLLTLALDRSVPRYRAGNKNYREEFDAKTVEILEVLLENGADVDAIDDNGVVPLHCAIRRCFLDAVEVLIANGVDVNLRDKEGLTPLHVAAQEGYPAVVEELLKAGADPCLKTPAGLTALDIARNTGHEAAAEVLMTHNKEE